MTTEPRAKLRWILQALAQPAVDQLQLFPGSPYVGEELAVEFESALIACRESGVSWGDSAATALHKLDAFMDSMSGEDHEDFWLDPHKLHVDPRWERMRLLALDALAAFDWSSAVPDPERVIAVIMAKSEDEDLS